MGNPMDFTSQWAILPARVRYDPELPPNAKLIFAEIAAKTNTLGYCWAHNRHFAETFERIGAQLQTAQKSYDQAKSQLNGGRGNIIRRLDALQNMGVTTGKHIPNKLKEE